MEPPGPGIGNTGPASAEGQRAIQWQNAVRAALEQWQTLLSITLVEHAEQAQVRLWRRRPPLQRLADGRTRASHGRAVLQLLQVRRGGREQLEPRVEVLLSPGQRALALQATALHELGHAFGLWGHSDDAGDAMAAVPGAMPVLRLSPRDRATMRWLLRQSDRLQTPSARSQSPAAAPRPAQAPTAD
jgi:predicted Zn-dependent protease